MLRPLALALPLSLAALACTPVADVDERELAAPEALSEGSAPAAPAAPPPTPTGPTLRVGPDAATCVGADRPTELAALDAGAPLDQGQMKIQRGDAWMTLPLQELRYDTVVVGTLAETTVTQVFHNPLPDRLEAIYTFPLPEDAAVDDYWIRVGTRNIHGVLKKREEAQKTYEDARNAGKTAALLTQERPNVFTQAVANIAPGEAIEVEIHLVQPLRQKSGRYTLALPTVVGPRYIPRDGSVRDAARITPPVLPAGASGCTPVDIHVAIDTTLPVTDVASKMHAVAVTPLAQGVSVALAGGPARADRDFELSWSLAGPRPRAELLAQKQGDGGYFALTIQPPQGFERGQARARELVFVVDVSGSMHGQPLDTARAAIERALGDMRDDDTFNVITFAGQADAMSPAAVANTADNRRRALDFLAAANYGGGTEMMTGITAALDAPRERERMRMVLFMTDGYVGNESQILRALEDKRGEARLFSLGVGSAVNRYLIEGLGRVGRGAATIMGPGEDPKVVVGEFYEHIDRPVLTDISIDWGGLAAEVTPSFVPDLFAGQPVVVYGRYTGELRGKLKLRGKLGGAEVELPVDLAQARTGSHDGLASMWARRRIDELSGYPLNQSPWEIPAGPQRDAVVDLALKHRIMTAYTAFVAVEERSEKLPDGTLRTVHVPVDMPAGVTMGAGEGAGLGTIGLIGHGGGGGTGSGYGRGSGAGFGGRGMRVPTVRQAKADVMGSLDKELVRRIVRAHINEVRHCYNQGLVKDPNLKGRVVVDFTVDKHGAVTKSVVAESTLTDADVAACIAKVVLRWKFPANHVGDASIRYPFVLEPG